MAKQKGAKVLFSSIKYIYQSSIFLQDIMYSLVCQVLRAGNISLSLSPKFNFIIAPLFLKYTSKSYELLIQNVW